MKYIDYVRRQFSDDSFPVFRISDVKTALKGKGISDRYARLMLHNLKNRGEIKAITRGVYTFHNDISVAGFAFQPFYYGLECALWIRGMSEQGTNFIVITPRNVRVGVRTFEGRNYRIQRIDKTQMFGYNLVKYGAIWVPVSDLEKTIIDMVYFKDNIREELWGKVISDLDLARLRNYLKHYDKEFAKYAMGLILNHKE